MKLRRRTSNTSASNGSGFFSLSLVVPSRLDNSVSSMAASSKNSLSCLRQVFMLLTKTSSERTENEFPGSAMSADLCKMKVVLNFGDCPSVGCLVLALLFTLDRQRIGNKGCDFCSLPLDFQQTSWDHCERGKLEQPFPYSRPFECLLNVCLKGSKRKLTYSVNFALWYLANTSGVKGSNFRLKT